MAGRLVTESRHEACIIVLTKPDDDLPELADAAEEYNLGVCYHDADTAPAWLRS